MTKGLTLVLLAVAAGAGFFAGRSTAPHEEARDVEPSHDDAPATAPSASDARPAPRLDAGGDSATSAFRDALGKMPTPVLPPAKGSISGTVRSADGKPLAGALITVDPRETGQKWNSSEDIDPADAIRQYAESLARKKALRRTATSGADGSYVVEGLADATLWVQAKLEGWRLSTTTDPSNPRARMGEIRPGAVVSFVGTPVSAVTFDVRMPDGSQAANASIQWSNGSNSSGTGWEPSRASADLEPGTWKVTARSGDEGLLVSDPADVVVEAGHPVSVRLDLREQPGIRLRIRWPEGETFPTAVVRIAEIGPDVAPDPAQLSGSGARREYYHSSQQGAPVLIRNVVAGRYAVGVYRYESDPDVVVTSAVVAASVVDAEVTMPPAVRSRYVVVRTLDPDGKPIPDPQIQLAMQSSTRSWSGGGTTLKRPDGAIWAFPEQRMGEAPADGHYWVISTAPRFGVAAVEYTPGDAAEATIRFQPAARVEIVCEGIKGSRLLSNVTAGVSPTGDWRRMTGRAGEHFTREGVATVGPVQPVPSEIVLSYVTEQWGGSVLSRTPIDLKPGEQRVVVELPRLHSVTFRLKKAGGWVSLRRDDDPTWNRHVQASGETVVVDALPDGVYKVNAVDRSNVSFTLPGSSEVDLR